MKMVKGILLFVGKTAVELMKIGGIATANTYTNQQLRKSTDHFIGEVERGVQHTTRKLNLKE